MTPERLSQEVMVAFNGTPYFSPITRDILREVLYSYFPTGKLHFFKKETKGLYNVGSSIVGAILKRRPRIYLFEWLLPTLYSP